MVGSRTQSEEKKERKKKIKESMYKAVPFRKSENEAFSIIQLHAQNTHTHARMHTCTDTDTDTHTHTHNVIMAQYYFVSIRSDEKCNTQVKTKSKAHTFV